MVRVDHGDRAGQRVRARRLPRRDRRRPTPPAPAATPASAARRRRLDTLPQPAQTTASLDAGTSPRLHVDVPPADRGSLVHRTARHALRDRPPRRVRLRQDVRRLPRRQRRERARPARVRTTTPPTALRRPAPAVTTACVAAAPTGTTRTATDCASCHTGMTCHDGVMRLPRADTIAFGDVCTVCHDGMDRPSGEAAACHVGVAGSAIPQIEYANDLACADADCHGAVEVHSGTPIDDVPCTDCHAGHYEELTACETVTRRRRRTITGPPRPGRSWTARGAMTAASPRTRPRMAPCRAWSVTSPWILPRSLRCARSATSAAGSGPRSCTTCHDETGLTGREQVHTATPKAGLACAGCHEAASHGPRRLRRPATAACPRCITAWPRSRRAR